jgi:apolipoprotein N-acyltransferase
MAPLRPAIAILLGALAGLLMLGAFAPLGWPPASWIALALVAAAWRGQRWTVAVAACLAFILAWGLAGMGWLPSAIAGVNRVHWGVGAVIGTLGIACAAVPWCLAAALCATLARRLPERAFGVVFAGAAGLAEGLRTAIEGLPTWYTIGVAQVDGPLRGFLALGGEPAAATAAAALAVAALEAARGLRAGQPRAAWTAAACAAVFAGVGWGAARVEWSVPAGAPFRAAIVQGGVAVRGDAAALAAESLRVHGELSRVAVEREGARVVAWGESAIRTPIDGLPRFVAGMRTAARSLGIDYVFGGLGAGQDGGAQAIVAQVIGAQDGRYTKRGLIPGIESFPPLLRRVLPDAWLPDVPGAVRGAARQPLPRIAGQPASLSICIEAIYGPARRRDAAGATLLVNLANDGWFAGSPQPEQHLVVARARAIELGLPMIRAADLGVSAFIDADGRVVASAPQGARTVIAADVQARRGGTPYGRFGVMASAVTMLLLLLGLGPIAFRQRRAR